jgi:hypothetical protein
MPPKDQKKRATKSARLGVRRATNRKSRSHASRAKRVEQPAASHKLLTKIIAERFLKQDGSVDISEFTAIADAAAQTLSEYSGVLDLRSLTSLSDNAARALGERKGDLNLQGVKTLSDAAALALGKHKGCLDLDGLTTLSDAAAQGLAHQEGSLLLNGLTSLSDSAARALGKHKGTLVLSELTSLSDAAAQGLAHHNGNLLLYEVTSLSDVAAQALAKHRGLLRLKSLTVLSETAARALAQHEGPLDLSDAAAQAIEQVTKRGRDSSGSKSTTGKIKRYELRAIGYCLEASAHKLSAAQLKELAKYCRQSGMELGGDLGDLEDHISSYSRYETNMWSTTIYPLVGSSNFVLFDSKNKQVFEIDDISTVRERGREDYVCRDGKGDVLVACHELKGTSAVWIIESSEVPSLRDFTFRVGRIVIGDEENEIVEGVDFKGEELDKDYDAESVDSKALSSHLL